MQPIEPWLSGGVMPIQSTGLLGVGQPAPAFALHATPDQTLTLAELRGRPVILVFYPADWSPVCGDQIGLYNELLGEFDKFGAQIVGISVDGSWCHAASRMTASYVFLCLPISSPRVRSHACTAYIRAMRGVSERALYVNRRRGKSSAGAICRPWESIPARTVFWKPLRTYLPNPPGVSHESLGTGHGATRSRSRSTQCGIVLIEYGDFECPYCGERTRN